MSVSKLISELGKPVKVHFLVAPQVVLSIARAYKLSPPVVFSELSKFFKGNFNTGLVLDIW